MIINVPIDIICVWQRAKGISPPIHVLTTVRNHLCDSLIHRKPLPFNSLGPSDAIWRHRSGFTLAQVMVCCLTSPNHHLNQYWLISKGVLWHSPQCYFKINTHNLWHAFEDNGLKIITIYPRGQWVEYNELHKPDRYCRFEKLRLIDMSVRAINI